TIISSKIKTIPHTNYNSQISQIKFIFTQLYSTKMKAPQPKKGPPLPRQQLQKW
ncbi:hypothetical protein Leryth_011730, partial [Lithospermum erythrorhizon]